MAECGQEPGQTLPEIGEVHSGVTLSLELAPKGGDGVSELTVLETDAADAGALAKLGVVKIRTGQAEQGIAFFRRAVEREPANGEALLYLAGALASNGRPAEALPFFERALRAGPRSSMALNGLGLTRLAVGDRPGAAAAFRESLRLDPKQPDVAQTLAEMGGRR